MNLQIHQFSDQSGPIFKRLDLGPRVVTVFDLPATASVAVKIYLNLPPRGLASSPAPARDSELGRTTQPGGGGECGAGGGEGLPSRTGWGPLR